LRKTAQLYQEEFDAEVVETVKHNIYVDDMIKSTSTTEKAVSLASQLRKLLEKGGFHLTKWYSNDREFLATIPESERPKSVVNLELEKLPRVLLASSGIQRRSLCGRSWRSYCIQ